VGGGQEQPQAVSTNAQNARMGQARMDHASSGEWHSDNTPGGRAFRLVHRPARDLEHPLARETLIAFSGSSESSFPSRKFISGRMDVPVGDIEDWCGDKAIPAANKAA
jgi:hypothetical protein